MECLDEIEDVGPGEHLAQRMDRRAERCHSANDSGFLQREAAKDVLNSSQGLPPTTWDLAFSWRRKRLFARFAGGTAVIVPHKREHCLAEVKSCGSSSSETRNGGEVLEFCSAASPSFRDRSAL